MCFPGDRLLPSASASVLRQPQSCWTLPPRDLSEKMKKAMRLCDVKWSPICLSTEPLKAPERAMLVARRRALPTRSICLANVGTLLAVARLRPAILSTSISAWTTAQSLVWSV